MLTSVAEILEEHEDRAAGWGYLQVTYSRAEQGGQAIP